MTLNAKMKEEIPRERERDARIRKETFETHGDEGEIFKQERRGRRKFRDWVWGIKKNKIH